MTNPIGVYWSVMHRRPQDYAYFAALQPSVFKIMDGGTGDYAWAREHLPNSLIIARDWALSEQHEDMFKTPHVTGRRHAQEWDRHADRLGFDRAKTLVLGINEPRVWDAGVPDALREYTIAMCDEATALGLRVGAMQLSVGWPNNTGPDTPPNWEPWHGVDDAIRRNNGALVLHEYWADGGPVENWGWWAGRSLKCPWDVPIVIGECGIDMYVKDGGVAHESRGWRGRKSPAEYANELAHYVGYMSQDERFVGCAVFATDFANREWASFDTEAAHDAILATPVPTLPDAPSTTPPHTTHIPQVGTGEPPQAQPPVPSLAHPIYKPEQRIISQRFGENLQDYVKFGLAGHNGVDFAVPNGTHVLAVDEGVVLEVGMDHDGYGLYVKLHHQWGESIYAHLLERFPKRGDQVYKGQWIGNSGNTGNSTGPHLHFAMRVYPYTRGYPFDGYVDPLPYLEGQHKPTSRHEIIRAVCAAAKEFGVDPDLLLSQAWAESSFNPYAVSSAGAQGLFQVMPATWGEWGPKVGASDPFNVIDSARVGAAYMAWLLKQTDGFEFDALVAYGWGIGNLLNNAGGVSGAPDMWLGYAGKIIHGRDLLRAVGA